LRKSHLIEGSAKVTGVRAEDLVGGLTRHRVGRETPHLPKGVNGGRRHTAVKKKQVGDIQEERRREKTSHKLFAETKRQKNIRKSHSALKKKCLRGVDEKEKG